MPDDSIAYVIGDIHGRADLLDILLGNISAHCLRYQSKTKYLIFLGDYVDRGLQSREVLEILANLNLAHITIVPLVGNHEEAMLSFIENPLESAGWLQYGGTETLLSYGVSMPPGIPKPTTLYDTAEALRATMPESHWQFLNNLHLSYTLGDYIFVHAGVNPEEPLADQSRQDILWIRDVFMSHDGLYDKVIVHGHTITKTVEFRPNRISVDTGAYYSNRLSCVILDGNTHQLLE